MTVKILLADDHHLVRQGLRALLEKEAEFRIVGEAADGRQAVKLTKELKPSVVVMDVAMPDLNGVEATRQIVESCPGTRVVALSMFSEERFVRRMLEAGAIAYLLKDCAFDDLARAVHEVAAGRTFLSAKVAQVVFGKYMEGLRRPGKAQGPLSPREREVLQLIAEGRSTKQIASTLKLSIKTVESHRKKVMTKLDLGSIAELTKYAIREGITSLKT